MKMRVSWLLPVAMLVPAAAFAAPAQHGATPPTQASKPPPGDPNEVVCEKQEVIGSRLAMDKICHTRAQWADLRNQDRQAVEKMQTQRGCTKNGC